MSTFNTIQLIYLVDAYCWGDSAKREDGSLGEQEGVCKGLFVNVIMI
jgi:hypothetical protein